MPRQTLPITRPPCPFGHKGDVWLDGFYAKGTDFERPRFFCQPKRDPAFGVRPPLHPDGRGPHKFIEPLARRHPTADEIRKFQPTLKKDKKDNFAGVWVDENGKAHVATAHGDNGIRKIAEDGLTHAPVMHEFAFTLDELTAIQDTIEADARANGWRLGDAEVSVLEQDVINNRVDVLLVKATSAQMASVADSYGPAVYVSAVDEPAKPSACYEYSCASPLKGGLRSYNSAGSERGMTAFVFRRTDGSGYLMATAGHAANLNESMYHPAGTYRGNVFYDIDSGDRIDAALWTITAAQASNKLFDYDGYARVGSITSRATEAEVVIGDPLCKSGRYAWLCGTLEGTNSDLSWVSDQYKANLYGQGGDSGAPIFYGTKAHGIATGNDCNGCSALYYTPVKRVEEFWSNSFMVLTYMP